MTALQSLCATAVNTALPCGGAYLPGCAVSKKWAEAAMSWL
jgi:hypothetical protein